MGYYTQFKIDISPDFTTEDENQEFNAKFYEMTGYRFDYGRELNGKWYDYQRDMRQISAVYPDRLFTVNGDGEDGEDLWRAYFKNGGMQLADAQVVYAPFDESKLQ